MSDHATFLAMIRANPADDGPRTVYADWLEEQGEGERAEFIRVQCELAQCGPCGRSGKIKWCSAPECRGCDLRRRDDELRHTDAMKAAASAFAAIFGLHYFTHDHGVEGGNSNTGERFRWQWSRGFLDSLTLSWPGWHTHADAILAAQPITKVRLTTRPEVDFSPIRETSRLSLDRQSTVYQAVYDATVRTTVGVDGRFIAGAWNGDTVPGEWPRTFGLSLEISDRDRAIREEACQFRMREFQERLHRQRTPEGYCHSRWPGVAFELPPRIIDARWGDTPRDIRADLAALRERFLQMAGVPAAVVVGERFPYATVEEIRAYLFGVPQDVSTEEIQLALYQAAQTVERHPPTRRLDVGDQYGAPEQHLAVRSMGAATVEEAVRIIRRRREPRRLAGRAGDIIRREDGSAVGILLNDVPADIYGEPV